MNKIVLLLLFCYMLISNNAKATDNSNNSSTIEEPEVTLLIENPLIIYIVPLIIAIQDIENVDELYTLLTSILNPGDSEALTRIILAPQILPPSTASIKPSIQAPLQTQVSSNSSQLTTPPTAFSSANIATTPQITTPQLNAPSTQSGIGITAPSLSQASTTTQQIVIPVLAEQSTTTQPPTTPSAQISAPSISAPF